MRLRKALPVVLALLLGSEGPVRAETGDPVPAPRIPDPPTRRAVTDALDWLARHQRPDGIWDRVGFDHLCPADDRCPGMALAQTDAAADVGVTALAVLAFLGSGHTHDQGAHAEQVRRAFEFILTRQTPDGSFSKNSSLQIYNDAIATLALAEALVQTGDPVFAIPLERAVRHLERAQQQAGGWNYTADTRAARNDTSVTGWVLMAFKAAAAAGVVPSVETRWRLYAHFARATEPRGEVWYADRESGSNAAEIAPAHRRSGPAMTAVGLFARSALGLRLDSPVAQRQIALLRGELPKLDAMMKTDPTGLHNEYYWYYGTLALFNAGDDPWREWHAALRNSILEYQERPVRRDGTPRHTYGSWPPYGRGWGKWGRAGGRIYATAINTLTLQIYYRHIPAFLSPRGLLDATEIRNRVAALRRDDERAALNLCIDFHPDLSEPLLFEFLSSRSSTIRRDAAIALAEDGSPVAAAELRRALDAGNDRHRDRVLRAIRNVETRAAAGPYGAVTAVDGNAAMFLFDTAGRPVYYGQAVEVLRGDEVVAVARVVRRFTTDRAAAASLDDPTKRVEMGWSVRTAAAAP
jgi:hypothetical protein